MSEFIWTDEMVMEFAYKFLENDEIKNMFGSKLEAFKKYKEVKPKDYEIMVMYNPKNKVEWPYSDCMAYPKNKNGGWEIKKVRRISDSEVFSVNDKVDYCETDGNFNEEFWSGTIESISFSNYEKGKLLFHINNPNREQRSNKYIENIRHAVPERTVEPKQIFEGYLDGKAVREHKGQLYIKYDGCKLDTLNINMTLTSQEECKELIKALEIHKFCFPLIPKT